MGQMIIFGTTGIQSVESRGSFHCPSCGPRAFYQRKSVRRFFTLFFVPLIPLNKTATHILCDRCGGTFKPEVLHWGGVVPGTAPDGPPPLPHGAIEGAALLHPSPAFTVDHESNGMAKASMILGIIGLLTSFLFCPSVFLCIVGLILGIIGLKRARKPGGVMGGGGQALAGIICSALGLLAIAGLAVAVARDDGKESAAASPRVKAARSISTSSEKTAYGNSPEAVQLAEACSKILGGLHGIAFESKKAGSPDKTRYMVHCELHEKTCAFLICVPQYRKFTDEAKTSLEEIAWTSARGLMKDRKDAGGGEMDLCVALKGVVMFGSVMTGKSGMDQPAARSKDEKEMDRFFVAAPAPGS